MIYIHRTIIVPFSITSTCQSLSEALSGEAGKGMWTTGLSPTGAEPATHFISTGMISDEFAAMIASPDTMFAACEAAGLPVTLAKCEGILGKADVSDEEPFFAIARLGLILVQKEEIP